MMDFTQYPNESEYEYIYRVGQAKDTGELDLSWEELCPILNSALGTEYTESTFRKKYAEGKKWLCVFEKFQEQDEFKRDIRTLQVERIKLRDERTELNRLLRTYARTDDFLEKLAEEIKKYGEMTYGWVPPSHVNSDNDLILSLADPHIGATFRSISGEYNSEIAKARLGKYLSKIFSIKKTHNSKGCYLALLGDLINGLIHKQIRVSNRENIIEQIMLCADLLSWFVFELSKEFEFVIVDAVPGNHSRLCENKDDEILGERLDLLIPWYMNAKLAHIENVEIRYLPDQTYNTARVLEVRGKRYVLVHGDFDIKSNLGVSDLVNWLGFKPDAIISGHMHITEVTIGKIPWVQCGALCGSGDEHTSKRRLSGVPSQVVLVCTEDGIEAAYPIVFDPFES